MTQTKTRYPLLLGALFAATFTLSAEPALATDNGLHADAEVPFVIAPERPQAPFGKDMDNVDNYSRAAPTVGAGGLISEGAMQTFHDAGFRTVVSLLTQDEGVRAHTRWARKAGIDYINLGVTPDGPDDAVLEAFKEIMADPEKHPVMVHCASANRVGALWARYRMEMGVPAEVAFQEGRTIGLQPELEQTVRDNLSL